MPKPWLPRVVSMSCMATRSSDSFGFHVHDFDEVCLVVGKTTIGHAGRHMVSSGAQLFGFRQGEKHGYWNNGKGGARFWVIHYRADPDLYRECPRLVSADPTKRVWQPSPIEEDQYKNLFIKVFNEHRRRGPAAAAAESAWLRLLLISIQRWSEKQSRGVILPDATSPDLVELWQRVNDHASKPSDLARTLSRSPNYDSLRHRFRAAFGASPSQLMIQLRMERAKTLLLETAMSVGAIAEAVGYGRQHEFARAFRRHVGRSPSQWRKMPES